MPNGSNLQIINLQPIHREKYFYISILLFFVVFVLVSTLYVRENNSSNKKHFSMHASIIADDLWALNHFGVTLSLQHVSQITRYQKLSVLMENHEVYVSIKGLSLSGLDQILYELHMIPMSELSEDIVYQGQRIGSLKGSLYNFVVYPLINIFIFLLLMLMVALYVFNLVRNRKLLRNQVIEGEEKYYESECRFQELTNLLPEMVCEISRKGSLTYANALMLSNFHIDPSDLFSVRFLNCISLEMRARARNYFNAILEEKQQTLEEFSALSTDGSIFPVLIRSSPIYKNKEVSGIRCVIINMSERHALEKKSHMAQRMEALGLMAGGVAHDLNNILAGIINYPELMLVKLPANNEFRKPLNAIIQSAQEAADIVDDMLTISRDCSINKVITNPNKLVEGYLNTPDFVHLGQVFPDITWTTSYDPSVGCIFCSTVHFRKSIMNLVTNAAEAITESGEVTISTTNCIIDDMTESDFINIKSGAYSVVSVHNTGPGIDAADMDHIFEPFYTKKIFGRSGTGLGLSIVWNTMLEHSGEIQVRCDTIGTTFSLYFPVTNKQIGEVNQSDTDKILKGNHQTVLVIDDNPVLRDISLELLSYLDYNAKAVCSGEEAVEYISGHPIDILLLDMHMPGIDGLEAYQQILRIYPKQQAVLVSGYSESSKVTEAIALGASCFLKKPYTMKDLAQVLSRMA